MHCTDHRLDPTLPQSPRQVQHPGQGITQHGGAHQMHSHPAARASSTTDWILLRYRPRFERARQACDIHWAGQDFESLIHEVENLCRMDESLVEDLCLMAQCTRQDATAHRQLRRRDIDRLLEAAARSGDRQALALGRELLGQFHARSLSVISGLRAGVGQAANQAAGLEPYDERYRDYGTVVADLDGMSC